VSPKVVLQAKGFQSPVYSVTCLAGSKAEEEHEENKGMDLAERNWNWRDPDFRWAPTRSKMQPGYIGSYAMDCLAMVGAGAHVVVYYNVLHLSY
jgi:ADP-ribosyl-[dinitrogen reductase] hydrolase